MTTGSRRLLCIATCLLALLGAGCAAGTPVASKPTASAGTLPAGFPIGSWTTTVTEADLRAGGITTTGDVGENAGVFTTTFAPDGTWTTAQQSSAPLRWPVFRGRWVAVGADTIRQTTTFPADFAGDVVDFTWRIEGDGLHMEVPDPPDPVLGVITGAHPWQRVP